MAPDFQQKSDRRDGEEGVFVRPNQMGSHGPDDEGRGGWIAKK
jgi:hypothetical protein